MTADERAHVGMVKSLPCSVCDAPSPSEAHEPKQGVWEIAIALCPDCHRGTHGWHGTRQGWKMRKMFDEIDALAVTLRRLKDVDWD